MATTHRHHRLLFKLPAWMAVTRRHAARAGRGFTLVEMIVAIGLFAIVMLVCVGALLSLVGANRKAQAMQSVMNNLSIALDDMVRTIRTGSNYRCNDQGLVGDGDCSNGGTALYLTPFGGKPGDLNDDIGYLYGGTCPTGQLCKVYGSVGSGKIVPITSSNIDITHLEFYVVGTKRTSTGDTTQPKVVITLTGKAAAGTVKTTTTFNIQTTAVQRLLDI